MRSPQIATSLATSSPETRSNTRPPFRTRSAASAPRPWAMARARKSCMTVSGCAANLDAGRRVAKAASGPVSVRAAFLLYRRDVICDELAAEHGIRNRHPAPDLAENIPHRHDVVPGDRRLCRADPLQADLHRLS